MWILNILLQISMIWGPAFGCDVVDSGLIFVMSLMIWADISDFFDFNFLIIFAIFSGYIGDVLGMFRDDFGVILR